MLKQFSLTFLSVVLLTACSIETDGTADNTLTEAEKADGWELLFDGNDINANWRGYKMEDAPTSWVIDDGAIFFNPEVGGTNGDIISREQYGQFEFALEWKVAPGSNSGIFYHVDESDQYEFPYETAPEMQVLDNDLHPDAAFKQHRAGDLYDLMESRVENVVPVGQWNKVRIIVRGNTVQHWQNDELVIETTMWDNNWAALIADSKFATWPGFAKSKTGHFALQDHTDPVWFKNLKVKRLD
jgi:3-keto-disaccharide hydrolase